MGSLPEKNGPSHRASGMLKVAPCTFTGIGEPLAFCTEMQTHFLTDLSFFPALLWAWRLTGVFLFLSS